MFASFVVTGTMARVAENKDSYSIGVCVFITADAQSFFEVF